MTLILYLQAFTYPEGIAFPLGGNGVEQFSMIEMHYDNPGNTEGTIILRVSQMSIP